MAANSVDSDQYVDGSIDAVHLSANSVDSDAYVDGSIDTAHIDALQVTGAKLNTDVISAQTELASEPADTDEFMVSDGGVLKRIDYSLIKGGGITEADSWVLSSSHTGSAAPLSSNLARQSKSGFSVLGTGMSESSGTFTFPSTGHWLVMWFSTFYLNGDSRYDNTEIKVTINNADYSPIGQSGSFITGNSSGDTYATASAVALIDVTATANVKVQFHLNMEDGATITLGSHDGATNMKFIRLADT